MTFQPKPNYLPEDVKHYAAPERHTHRYWAALAACLALVAWVEETPIAAPQAVPTLSLTPTQPTAAASALLAACFNGHAISWRDPHRGDMLTVCDTHTVQVRR